MTGQTTAGGQRQQIADEVERVLLETVGTQMPRGMTWNLSKPLDALLPLFDRVAANAAADALTDVAHRLDDAGDGAIEVALGGAPYVHRVLCDRATSLRPSPVVTAREEQP